MPASPGPPKLTTSDPRRRPGPVARTRATAIATCSPSGRVESTGTCRCAHCTRFPHDFHADRPSPAGAVDAADAPGTTPTMAAPAIASRDEAREGAPGHGEQCIGSPPGGSFGRDDRSTRQCRPPLAARVGARAPRRRSVEGRGHASRATPPKASARRSSAAPAARRARSSTRRPTPPRSGPTSAPCARPSCGPASTPSATRQLHLLGYRDSGMPDTEADTRARQLRERAVGGSGRVVSWRVIRRERPRC